MSAEGPRSQIGDPAWEIATLFPNQGCWSEYEYLRLDTMKLVELSDGKLEVLPVPTELHQLIVLFLSDCLRRWAEPRSAGMTLMAPLRVRLWEGNFREPDVVFMLSENGARRSNDYWDRADLVMEVVSDDDPRRDLVEKRADYARAGIPEYWIVDPRDKSVRVLSLAEGSAHYEEAGYYASGQTAASILLESFSVSVDDTFNQIQ